MSSIEGVLIINLDFVKKWAYDTNHEFVHTHTTFTRIEWKFYLNWYFKGFKIYQEPKIASLKNQILTEAGN